MGRRVRSAVALACAVGAGAFLWDRAAAPLGWIALGGGIAALVLGPRAGKLAGERAGRLLWAAGSALIALGALELGLWLTAPVVPDRTFADLYVPDDDLGYLPAPGVTRGSIVVGDVVSFDVEYTITPQRHRATPDVAPEAGGPTVVCLGGSCMFGLGLAAGDDLPSRLQAGLGEDARVVNLANPGWGAHQALAQVQSGRVAEIAAVPPMFCVYWAIPDHVSRGAGKAAFDRDGPLFVLQGDGRVARRGSFADRATDADSAANAVHGVRKRSLILRRLRERAERRRRTPATIDDVDRWAGIVATIADEVGQRFPGCELVVLMEDRRGGFAPEMLERLASIDCRVLRTSEMMPEEPMHPTRWTLPRDPHPSAEATEHIARSLADSLRVRTEGGR
ncbi:MAG: hypothetical protein AAGI22_22420 [Planctomycetota bacterium]